jgi:hypothetical protein
MPTTNLLAMPLAILKVETGTNEDWIDSLKYVVDTGEDDPPQLDLRGIAFEMEVRRRPEDHEVVISASTADGTLAIGDAPDFGFLLINIDKTVMEQQKANEYVADIVGIDVEFRRVVVQIDLTIFEGITR